MFHHTVTAIFHHTVTAATQSVKQQAVVVARAVHCLRHAQLSRAQPMYVAGPHQREGAAKIGVWAWSFTCGGELTTRYLVGVRRCANYIGASAKPRQ